ncbi:ring-cleaving dioxygenase [Alicyclobacillus fastidiosus]|uniref:Ring-cleaving dioxygenase n=1 Tax=Alicyclobacillus fastidiosus TaxID=392011 RepID=A0ABV5AC43_9BACL|nr:ring-cleaving dioxygenase [Alicyclobacillus fastidiosus]WEH11460.1 ring-cleaving dioxygenase [Alicyclobacillus fastidiosus]
MEPLTGIHHVSMFTANPRENYEFYTKTMGMRLVKKTVNQDRTSSYHLFYGDHRGAPGTQVTFFDIPRAARTHRGVSSISKIGLRVSNPRALEYWRDRLQGTSAGHLEIAAQMGRDVLDYEDFEGLPIVMVSDEGYAGGASGTPCDRSVVPPEFSIRGLGPVTFTVRDADPTLRTLIDVLGFREIGHYASRVTGQPDIRVLETGDGGTAAQVHVEERHDLEQQKLGRGGVHHVAFRVPTNEQYLAWYERVEAAGLKTTGLIDRYYFRSMYFREPSGIMIELATDGPGLTVDETLETLGENLVLPPFLEGQRASIEAKLPPFNTSIS